MIRPPEPLVTIILMRVVNLHAPRAGEVGHIVTTEGGGAGEGIIIVLEFADGERVRFARIELEMVMP